MRKTQAHTHPVLSHPSHAPSPSTHSPSTHSPHILSSNSEKHPAQAHPDQARPIQVHQRICSSTSWRTWCEQGHFESTCLEPVSKKHKFHSRFEALEPKTQFSLTFWGSKFRNTSINTNFWWATTGQNFIRWWPGDQILKSPKLHNPHMISMSLGVRKKFKSMVRGKTTNSTSLEMQKQNQRVQRVERF